MLSSATPAIAARSRSAAASVGGVLVDVGAVAVHPRRRQLRGRAAITALTVYVAAALAIMLFAFRSGPSAGGAAQHSGARGGVAGSVEALALQRTRRLYQGGAPTSGGREEGAEEQKEGDAADDSELGIAKGEDKTGKDEAETASASSATPAPSGETDGAWDDEEARAHKSLVEWPSVFGGEVGDGLSEAAFIELEVVDVPWRVVKVLVPLEPRMARWWTSLDPGQFFVRVKNSNSGPPQIHVEVGSETVGGADVHIRGSVTLPEDAILQACRVGSKLVTADVGQLVDLGPIRALIIICPVRNSGSGNALAVARKVLNGHSPLRWLLLPWIVMLMPFILGLSLGPAALVGGACLTLASFASLAFLLAILIVMLQRRCSHCTRRWRRLWRLRKLSRWPAQVDVAFGQHGPCCICLGEPTPSEALIALLPCRHALHIDCYKNWVRADSYPSHDLICPLCRRRAEAIGKLAV
mmetsp:Transcript_83017/g.231750  ORF Transcript_83017/g.231750 Transcript_83017/m.231750 type:complete len:469 (+) Transcript_83017:73-1479(+)